MKSELGPTKDTPIYLRVPKALSLALKKAAKNAKLSISEFIRRAIEEKIGNDSKKESK